MRWQCCACAAVIKMEGGTENDLRILEQPVEDEEEREKLSSGGLPSENQKRDENRGAESDRKAPAEKDDKEVCVLNHTLVQRRPLITCPLQRGCSVPQSYSYSERLIFVCVGREWRGWNKGR